MTAIADFLAEEIEAGSFPGASALWASPDEVIEEAIAGEAAIEPSRRAVSAETLFDLASLTKPLCAGALVAAAGDDLELSWAPGRFLPEWKRSKFDGVTLEHLLTHTSGLAPWFPLYTRGEGRHAYRRALAEMEPEEAPGRRVLYSDLNFLLLTEILENVFAAPLDRVFEQEVARPAGSGARFLPARELPTAATEKADRFERVMTEARGLSYEHFRTDVVWGQVHDGNAFRRGGVSGHAGVFATARDAWLLARPWLEPGRAAFRTDRTPELSEARGLSWQGRRGAGSAIPEMSAESFGHTGFTGCSVWIDPGRERIAILLTNRIHPEVREIPFNEVRQRFHRAVFAVA